MLLLALDDTMWLIGCALFVSNAHKPPILGLGWAVQYCIKIVLNVVFSEIGFTSRRSELPDKL